ncbi:MAG: hypothetical protein HZA54_01125 [Planctomycetes bacterium]|nr:hypothetical protein [Planctomycetota bacterium]
MVAAQKSYQSALAEFDASVAQKQTELAEVQAAVQEAEANLKEREDPENPLVKGEAQAKAAYLASLPALYSAERAAAVSAPPAPHDPNGARADYVKGRRVKLDVRIISVKEKSGGNQVKFARGPGTDPAGWKDEAYGVVEPGLDLKPGTVMSLETVLTPGQEPPWRILGATERK